MSDQKPEKKMIKMGDEDENGEHCYREYEWRRIFSYTATMKLVLKFIGTMQFSLYTIKLQ